jgi:hypothetical protein
MSNEPPLTLERHRWYAMLRQHAFGAQDYAPIWIEEVKPMQSGKGLLEVAFWDANYPAGVRDKVYRLRVLRREAGFILAERQDYEPKELVVISEMTGEWVRHHFRETPVGDVQAWLDGRCGHP